MKATTKTKGRISSVHALVIVFSLLCCIFTFTAVKFSQSDKSSLCEHHPEHTAQCGYIAGEHECEYICSICNGVTNINGMAYDAADNTTEDSTFGDIGNVTDADNGNTAIVGSGSPSVISPIYCDDENGRMICKKAAHLHSEACDYGRACNNLAQHIHRLRNYCDDKNGNIICGKDEHTHSAECSYGKKCPYVTHIHNRYDCYTNTCPSSYYYTGTETSADHVHTDDCFTSYCKSYNNGVEHAHSTACSSGNKCPREDHTHNLQIFCDDKNGNLTCGKTLHIHDSYCNYGRNCSIEFHVHKLQNYCDDKDGNLICKKTEHMHDVSCNYGNRCPLKQHSHSADRCFTPVCPLYPRHQHSELCQWGFDCAFIGTNKSEHVHTDACFTSYCMSYNGGLEHTHNEECNNGNSCPLEPHLHNLQNLPLVIGDYPEAVVTENISTDTNIFYNVFVDPIGTLRALPGVEYTLYNEIGEVVTTIRTKSKMEVPIESTPENPIPPGTYTMRQTDVPSGYVINPRTWTVTVSIFEDGSTHVTIKDDANRNVGIIYNYAENLVNGDKNATVSDYENRFYRVDITMHSELYDYIMDPINMTFVVDQSNSMLFPADLDKTGRELRVLLNDPRTNEMELEYLKLDKSQIYYLIGDREQTATVFAVWWNGEAWMFQDASYYYKAYENTFRGGNYLITVGDSDVKARFPTTDDDDYVSDEVHGGRVNSQSFGRLLGLSTNYPTDSFTVYTARADAGGTKYTRLTYLKQALDIMARQLAYLQPESQVSLVKFARTLGDCFPNTTLSNENSLKSFLDAVNDITTLDGTNQGAGLRHVMDHGNSHLNNRYPNYVVLITDGAPNVDDGEAIFRNAATELKRYSPNIRLITVGLSMENVLIGQQLLYECASSPQQFYHSADSSYLRDTVLNRLFNQFVTAYNLDSYGDVYDEISDSFYPVDPETGNPLKDGSWISFEGKEVPYGDRAAGQVFFDGGNQTWGVRWPDQLLPSYDYNKEPWHGTLYIKAKEDFIGGNAIDTNKRAYAKIGHTEVYLPTPTVNVRLLPMTQTDSEVTVFLGDIINNDNPGNALQSLEYLFNQVRFAKIRAGLGSILNDKTWDITYATDCDDYSFNLLYAIGRYSDISYEELCDWIISQRDNGSMGTITYPGIQYTYDHDSSHGPVGYFTLTLTKVDNYKEPEINEALWNAHKANETGKHIETYTLTVNYTAYRLGQNGRPSRNINNYLNGSSTNPGPGTEVGTGSRVENGLGSISSTNNHWVNVISGAVALTKKLSAPPANPVSFTFHLTQLTDEEGQTPYTDTVTISFDPSENGEEAIKDAVFTNIPRGRYIITEDEDIDYILKGMNVEERNCYVEEYTEEGYPIIYIGTDTDQNDAVQFFNPPRYENNLFVYSRAYDGDITAKLAVENGLKQTDPIPLKLRKLSGDDKSPLEGARFELYEADDVDEDGNIKEDAILIWEGTSDKEGMFENSLTVTGPSSYRLVETKAPAGYTKLKVAIEINVNQDGKIDIFIPDETPLNYFMDEDGTITLEIPNYIDPFVELPSTGGIGTTGYYIAGCMFVISAAGLMFILNRKKKENMSA